jgi:hypothetical protein
MTSSWVARTTGVETVVVRVGCVGAAMVLAYRAKRAAMADSGCAVDEGGTWVPR